MQIVAVLRSCSDQSRTKTGRHKSKIPQNWNLPCARETVVTTFLPGFLVLNTVPLTAQEGYIGMTNRSVATRSKESDRHVRLNQPDKSPVGERAITEGHNPFQPNKVISRNAEWMRLALEIAKQANNFKPNSAFQIGRIWRHFYAPNCSRTLKAGLSTRRRQFCRWCSQAQEAGETSAEIKFNTRV